MHLNSSTRNWQTRKLKKMNRIDQKFKELRKAGKKAFIVFITAGDPRLKTTEKLVLSFENNGVDIVELGVPFSDPLADGPTIQASSYRALRKGVSLEKILKSVSRIRTRSQIPIALMTYYNPVFHFGEEQFFKKAKACGVDGIIVPDLPPEEAGRLIRLGKQYQMATIFFLSPTTTNERMAKVMGASTGFIYYVSLTGVTGARKNLTPDIRQHVRLAKRMTKKPVCVGFGIGSVDQVRAVGKYADGVIVGSAIVSEIAKHAGKKDLLKRVSSFVKTLSGGL